MVNALIENGSTIFPKNYHDLSEKEQIKILSKVEGEIDLGIIKDDKT